MTISDQLLLLNSTKTAIAAAIENKGVTVGAVPFADYPAKIAEISGGGTPTTGWVRPADWLELPEVLETDQKMVGLHAVFSDANFLALKCTGGYTVDWGDGVVENFASGVQANHEYDFNNPALAASITALPYKQAIVTVTPQTGQNLTSLNLFVKHNQAGLVNGYASGWLDLRISGQSLATLTISGTSTSLVRHTLLEQVEILNSGVTSMSYMFNSCYSLTSIPLLNTGSVTNMSYMFSSCYSLTSIPLLDTSSVTNMSYMFNCCYSLTSMPMLDTGSVTNMSSMFYGCRALASIPLLNTGSVTNMSYMFYGCYALASIPALNTSSVTSMPSMFYNCYALASIPVLDTSSVTNMSSMFFNCYALASIPLLDTGSVTDMSSMFYNCLNLSSINTIGTKITHSVANCKLSAAALNAYYTNLPTVTGQTLTVTGNYGVLGDDPSIATAKGWTVTG